MSCIYRLAKQSDYRTLAKIHMECGKVQVGSFMHKLGLLFLQTYYKVYLKERKSVILIAEDEKGIALGFNSGTLDASEHLENMKKHKLLFALSIIPGLLKNPGVIRDVLLRNKYVSSQENSVSFGVKTGARGEYWAWRPGVKDPAASVMLRQAWINILFDLGCRSFKYELDSSNTDIEKYQKIFKCVIIEEIVLPDGRKRVIVEQSMGRPKLRLK
jgi:hypothetical protein